MNSKRRPIFFRQVDSFIETVSSELEFKHLSLWVAKRFVASVGGMDCMGMDCHVGLDSIGTERLIIKQNG